MSNMTIDQIQQKVIEYWQRVLDNPDTEIGPDSNLIDDLALSSLEIFISLMTLEDQYGIRIPEHCLRSMTTPRTSAQIIFQLLDANGDTDERRK